MSMRDLHMGFRLTFETEQDQANSEEILLRILGINSLLNLMYLRKHPDTVPLYESGVVYTPPDQADGRPPLDRDKLKQLLKLIRDMGQEPETALMVVRMLKGIEIFLDIPALYRRGKGDCNELVPVRVAELWRAGIAASPYLIKSKNERGGFTYHAILVYKDGSYECPSAILGMSSPEIRREEIRKNVERLSNYVQAAQRLIAVHGAPPAAVSAQIDEMGLVPRDGVFRSPYKKAA